MLASGPGCSPRSRADSVRSRIRSSNVVLGVHLGEALAQVRIGDRPVGVATASSISSAVGPVAPQHAAGRQRHALVAERDLGQPPAVVEVADEVRGGDAHIGEEHLVERVPAGHLRDRADLDARAHPSGR